MSSLLSAVRSPRPFRPAWLSSPRVLRTEVLAGLVVALALIPEAISFSILAGVDPRVGLFASFTMAVTIAFTGGRPAMISAATGAIALVVAPLAKEHGLDYLIAAVVLGGVFQVILALAGVAKLMRFIPRSVMVGFVNALAILIFTAQVPHLIGVPWLVYPMVAVALAIMVFLPKLTTVVPAPLVAIVALTVFTGLSRTSPCRTSAVKARCRTACPPSACRICPTTWTPCGSSPRTRRVSPWWG
jgi:sulfate permease, SulP family